MESNALQFNRDSTSKKISNQTTNYLVNRKVIIIELNEL